MKKFEQRKKNIFIFGVAVIMAIVFVMLMVLNSDSRKLNKLLDLGQKYLEDADYENAVLVFDQAIAIEPKCEEAYLGKARAQYASGMYEEAVATLEKGIASAEGSQKLKALLDQILAEITEKEIVEEETTQIEERMIPLYLNYSQIVRYSDTEKPTVQLEILGEEGGREKYIWESSNPECAVVSETGLVTCLSKEGYSYITVATEDGTERDGCQVWIVNPEASDSNPAETENLWTIVESEKEEEQFFIMPVPKEDEENIIVGNFNFPKYIYYSGDITIPEKLEYNGKTWPITGMISYAFMFCDELESIHIPSAVEVLVNNSFNPFLYCKNLQEIEVDSGNQNWKSVDGVLYSADGKQLLSYPAAKNSKTYILPKEVESVYSGAFLGCNNLEEILVEDGNQFYESIDGSLVQKEERRLVAYPTGNKALSYEVPDSIKEIDTYAFGFSALEEVVCRSVESIDSLQFMNSDRLKRIVGGTKTKNICMDMAVEIAGLDEMENLESLYITLAKDQEFNDLSALQKLKTVTIDVDGLSPDLGSFGSSNVENLVLSGIDNMKDFSWLLEMDSLKDLSVSIENKKIDLQVLGGLTNLENLDIRGANYINDLSSLSGLTNLESLRIDINGKLVDLQVLGKLTGLDVLYIDGIDKISDFSWLANMRDLKDISLIADNNSSLEIACKEIGKLGNVEKITVRGISKLEDLSWLENMGSLGTVSLSVEDKFNVTDLTPIMELRNLKGVTIYIPEEDKKQLSDSILQQVEELRNNNVTINFLIS